MEQLGLLCSPVESLLFFAQRNFQKHTPNTKNKGTKQCPFWSYSVSDFRATTTIRSYLWRSDAVMDVILREEARYDVPKVPLASPELIYVTVCFHVVVGEIGTISYFFKLHSGKTCPNGAHVCFHHPDLHGELLLLKRSGARIPSHHGGYLTFQQHVKKPS